MRQRRIKNIEEKLLAYDYLVVNNPEEQKDSWRSFFDSGKSGLEGIRSTGLKDASLYLEIGCGKGRFITESAKADKESLYLAVEGVPSVVYRALDKVSKEEVSNVKFITKYVDDVNDWFGEAEIDGIFLNFSDPWPKARTAKRRLTYREKLNQYYLILKLGGFIRIKTDNDAFFDFTLEEIEAVNMPVKYEVAALTRDLHKSEWAGIGPMTEYEKKFTNLRKNINFVELRKV